MEKVVVRIAVKGEAKECVAHGSYSAKAHAHYVIYEESADAELGRTRTTLRWDESGLTLIRHGECETRLEFALGEERSAVYIVSGLRLDFTVFTHSLQIKHSESKWLISLDYSLRQLEAQIERRKMRITIEEE